MIRYANLDDVERALDMAEAKRQQYADYQPIFHRPAASAREVQGPYFRDLIERDDVLAVVHEGDAGLDGFVTAERLHGSPISYMVDDFVVARPDLWPSAGRALLDRVRDEARKRGGVHMQVHCGPLDTPKRTLLSEAGLRVMRQLVVNHDPLPALTQALAMPDSSAAAVRPAQEADVEVVLDMLVRQLRVYKRFDPIFYRYSGDREKERANLAESVQREDSDVLAAEVLGKVRGLIAVTSIPPPPVYDPGGPVYFVSHFVAAPDAWATAGLALFIAALELLATRGAALVVASAMPGDPEQSAALARAGLTVVTEFFREDLAVPSGGAESE